MRRGRVVGISLVAALVAAACSPGSNSDEETAASSPSAQVSVAASSAANGSAAASSTTATGAAPSSAAEAPTGPRTLTYWDVEPGALPKDRVDKLDRQFEQEHPGVTVERVAKSFEDLTATQKLGATDPKTAPDLLLTNQGWNAQVPLAKAGLIVPLDTYSEKYGWDQQLNEQIQQVDSVKVDGDATTFGQGDLYCVSLTAQFLGVYYNRAKLKELGLAVPTTFDEFVKALDTAKAAGVTPIMTGTSEQWPALHLYSALQNLYAQKKQLRDWIFRGSGEEASFVTPENVKAAATLQDFVKKDYFNKGFAGVSIHDALGKFGAGEGLFLVQGTWFSANVKTAMGTNAGMFLLPAAQQPVAATGGPGPCYAITKWSANPDLAAEYLNFRLSKPGAESLVEAGGLPSTSFDYTGSDPLTRDIFESWNKYLEVDAGISFLDYSAPGMLDVIQTASQELVGLKISPDEFVKRIQTAYERAGK